MYIVVLHYDGGAAIGSKLILPSSMHFTKYMPNSAQVFVIIFVIII